HRLEVPADAVSVVGEIVVIVGHHVHDRDQRIAGYQLPHYVAGDAAIVGPLPVRPEVPVKAASAAVLDAGDIDAERHVDELEVARHLPEVAIAPVRVERRAGPDGVEVWIDASGDRKRSAL